MWLLWPFRLPLMCLNQVFTNKSKPPKKRFCVRFLRTRFLLSWNDKNGLQHIELQKVASAGMMNWTAATHNANHGCPHLLDNHQVLFQGEFVLYKYTSLTGVLNTKPSKYLSGVEWSLHRNRSLDLHSRQTSMHTSFQQVPAQHF